MPPENGWQSSNSFWRGEVVEAKKSLVSLKGGLSYGWLGQIHEGERK